ncbi:hypothetical protein [Salinibacter sp.]|uniref:hypothetical protein n=1 Tax=Salinibacter sp. TaxID=2065818 RepID=UPI0021E8F137|nr:hypothetical protein [Salinibacter sp.]
MHRVSIDEAPVEDRWPARESIQRVLDQCVERGQIHRLHQWATKLNKICHGEE